VPRVAVVGCGDVPIVHFEARPNMEPRPTISHGPGGVDGGAAGAV
jgi:hypothetical protein